MALLYVLTGRGGPGGGGPSSSNQGEDGWQSVGKPLRTLDPARMKITMVGPVQPCGMMSNRTENSDNH